MARMSAGYAVAEALAAQGVRHVMGLVGSCVVEVLDGMYGREDMSFLSVRHEQAAAMMADGFARIAGSPAVCMATNGPGACNLVTGVANAFLAQSPVVVLTGAPMLRDQGRDSTQEVDQVSLFRPITKWSVQVKRPERVADTIREAFGVARAGMPGPVHVDLPRDLLMEEVEFAPARPEASPLGAPGPDPGAVERAAELLASARRPFIVAGGGVLWCEATGALVEVAERLGAPVGTATGRNDAFPSGHPLSVGPVGRGALPEAVSLLREADVVLAAGTRLAHSTTFFSPAFFGPGAQLIHLALEPRTIGRNYPAAVGIVADIRRGLEALGRALPARRPPERPELASRLAALREAHRRQLEEAGRMGGVPIKPQRFYAELARQLPEEAIVALDVGSACHYAYGLLSFGRPRTFLASQDLACIGFGFPAALGAKLARPDRPVVCVSGDGGFLCNGAELETAVRLKLPVTTFILNNFNFGSERAYQKFYYDGRYVGDAIGNPPFDEYARAFGARGFRVERPEELGGVVAEALREPGPTLVDILTDADELPEPRRRDAVRPRRRE